MLNITKNPSFFSKIRIIILLLLLLIFGIFVLFYSKKSFTNLAKSNNGYVYKYHYAFIADNFNDPFINDIYISAKNKGKENDIYVDSFLDSHTTEYSKSDYLSIAIAAKVDGIILVGETNSNISSLIDKAISNKIPIVTILNDCDNKKCNNFIGIDNYKLGTQYGLLIGDIIKSKDMPLDNCCNIALLKPASQFENEKDKLKEGITDCLKEDTDIKIDYSISEIILEKNTPFSSANATRKLILDDNKKPNIIVCLTKEDTLNVYATLIDLDKIKNTKIFGFYDSKEILEGVSKQLIYATVKPNTEKIGYECIDSLLHQMSKPDDTKNNTYLDSNEWIKIDNVDKYLNQSKSIPNNQKGACVN